MGITYAASEIPEAGITAAPDTLGESGTSAKSNTEYDCEVYLPHPMCSLSMILL